MVTLLPFLLIFSWLFWYYLRSLLNFLSVTTSSIILSTFERCSWLLWLSWYSISNGKVSTSEGCYFSGTNVENLVTLSRMSTILMNILWPVPAHICIILYSFFMDILLTFFIDIFLISLMLFDLFVRFLSVTTSSIILLTFERCSWLLCLSWYFISDSEFYTSKG